MPANIDSYIGRRSAFHNLGTVTGHYLTWEEIQAHGELDYMVFKSQLYDGLGRPVNAWGTFRLNRVDARAGRKEAAVFLSSVGEDYKVIQHAEGFRMTDALIASVDGAHYETAGSLGIGERVWGLADLGLSVSVGADRQTGYLLFATGHDGSLSHQYRIVLTRVVCANTLAVALSEKSRAKLTVRHTKNAMDRLASAHEVLSNLRSDMLSVEEKLNLLARKRVTREAFATVLDRLFPPPKDEETGEEKESSTRRKNILSEIISLYESNDGNAFPEQRGTAYNLLNAVTEFTDHLRNKSDLRARSESALFGSGAVLKTRAMEVIMESASGMPDVQTRTIYASNGTSAVPSSGLLDSVLDMTRV